jgi:hypothetical protein
MTPRTFPKGSTTEAVTNRASPRRLSASYSFAPMDSNRSSAAAKSKRRGGRADEQHMLCAQGAYLRSASRWTSTTGAPSCLPSTMSETPSAGHMVRVMDWLRKLLLSATFCST